MNEWKSISPHINENCFYLPNCIHENKINQIASNNYEIKTFNKENFNIICVASIQFRKGQDIILIIYMKLNKNSKAKFTL